MKQVSLTIDGKLILANEGDTILWAALDHGIYIPNLCALRERKEHLAGCRLCFVEVEGQDEPVISCTEPAREGMVVNTLGEIALRLARTSGELLFSSHPADCGHCARNDEHHCIVDNFHNGDRKRIGCESQCQGHPDFQFGP